MATGDRVIDVQAEAVDPPTERYRFIGNHLTLNSHHVAYILNIMGVHVSPEMYEKMPQEIKEHFAAIKM